MRQNRISHPETVLKRSCERAAIKQITGHTRYADIKGKIVTYRLSPEGAKSLHNSGVPDDGKFPWSMLLELIRSGDAFTGNGSDVDLSGWTQTELPLFAAQHEPSPTDPVPLCGCSSPSGLHVVGLATKKTALILCDTCRANRHHDIDVSVPLYLITTPAALERLLERNGLSPDETVTAYRDLLSLNLVDKYRARVRPKRATNQEPLFPAPETPQGNLL